MLLDKSKKISKQIARRMMKFFAKMGVDKGMRTSVDVDVEFKLIYKEVVVGILNAAGGKWTFHYTDEFRHDPPIKPLMIFPNVDKLYEASELWPFFRMRVPSLKQPAIRKIVDQEQIDEHDQVELLRRFGRRTISNPFELISADH